MATQVKAIDQLIYQLSKLPGIGEKTAMRLAFYIIKREDRYAEELAQALLEVKRKVRICGRCQNLSEEDLCSLCTDARRDHRLLCVVEKPSDLIAVERTGCYNGDYLVLHGALSPMDGIGPDELKIQALFERLRSADIAEVILATNPTLEGEATALYLTKHLRDMKTKITKIASGVPIGGELEYIDQLTLGKALEGRHVL